MKPPRCKGILGLISGHKFLKKKEFRVYRSDYCFRCGWYRRVD